MFAILPIIQALGPYAWFILGATLFIAETILPGFNLIWFGVAASGVGATMLIVPLSWEWQLIGFIVLAALAVLAGRQLAARRVDDGADRVNRGPDAMIGKTLTLAEPIVDNYGRATYGDTLWRVRGHDQPAGTMVKVVAVDAATLVVEPARPGA